MRIKSADSSRPMCGFCMTGHHDSCKPVIKYYDKEWYCYCENCHPMLLSEQEQKEEINEQETGTTGDIKASGDID